ncbi:ComEA family DNA-binding protein [Sphingobacterium corticibacter]|uniref:Helix-hairpin-helix domain-containing protein n=1 Tax=Sphingobacterium corticibacter TaxID=2171749 RepID=A0A2T8HMK7_9SPHI|nr:helix-hairpin-helix domain-containing protein [Sphingobacterium corticibacter]PVH26679.1 hypothetical protein DC487_03450 [Sphingobacterium corticibacter]
MMTLAPFVWTFFRKPAPLPAYSVQTFAEDSSKYNANQTSVIKRQKYIDIKPFDPNRLPAEEWSKLGLSDKQIAVIHRYEERGGVFRKKEDVQKMYVIDKKLYRQIAPFIRIGDAKTKSLEYDKEQSASSMLRSNPSEYRTSVAQTRKTTGRIDMNRSDTTDWKNIRGIGSTYASRIVRYRELLGGFHQPEQLSEVYGLPSEQLEEWYSQVYIKSPVLRKIQINDMNANELQRHPYIAKKQAERIVQYRNQHGKFRSIDDMRKILMLDTDFFTKIELYLDFQQ